MLGNADLHAVSQADQQLFMMESQYMWTINPFRGSIESRLTGPALAERPAPLAHRARTIWRTAPKEVFLPPRLKPIERELEEDPERWDGLS